MLVDSAPNSPVKGYRRTKIVATLGPASRSPEMVRQLITAGVNVFRLNFSHGSHEEHLQILQTVRAAEAELKIPVAILQDLSGPKIRISPVEGDFVVLEDGGEVALRFADGTLGNAKTIYVELLKPHEILSAGEPVLLADGMIALRAEEVTADSVRCRVEKGGRLRSRVGIAFPDSSIDLPATTKKDLKDMLWGIENKVDYVAVSFVATAQDILTLRDFIKKEGGDLKIIAKIERRHALKNINEILDVSDGLMVARGDLGLEYPLERLPLLQKKLIEEANYRGIPVIVATQMLHSMITSVRPTRAEVSDIATAVMSGTDAVMLSDETAIGEHPLEAVRYLSRVAHHAEQVFEFEEYKLRLREADRQTRPDAVAYAACAAAIKVQAKAIVACSETGTSARLVAKYRPQQPLYGASRQPSTLRRMCMYWGVVPISCDPAGTGENEFTIALRAVAQRERCDAGSVAVAIGGHVVGQPGTTSVMEIVEMSPHHVAAD